MRRIPVAIITSVGLAVLAACSGDNTATSPRGISAQAASLNLTLACSFNTMGQDAKNYFPNRDPVFTMISDMKTLYRTSVAAATPKGFDVLARLADVRRAGQQIGSSTIGGAFALDVVGCMDVGAVPDKFTPAAALAAGVFEVRGASGSAPAAVAYNSAPGNAGQASPLWGAEPNPSGDWLRPAAPYGRYLIYGYPRPDIGTNAFELGTLPDAISTAIDPGSPQYLFNVGLCVHEVSSSSSVNRLLHLGVIVTGTNTLKQGASFCLGNVVSAQRSSWLRALASRTFDLIAPKSLNAQGDEFGIGGLPSGWSPFNQNGLTGTDVALAFTTLPTNAVDSTNTTVVVHASSAAFPNVPGVAVSIKIAGNNGITAQAVLISGTNCQPNQDCTPLTVATDKNGNATFIIQIGKSGGYTLTATGMLSNSVPTQSVTSVVFNVKNN